MLRVSIITTMLIFGLFFSMSLPLSAQTENQAVENDEIEIPFGWDVGDKRRYSVKQIDYKKGSAKPTKNSIFAVEIISESEDLLLAKCNLTIVVAADQRMKVEANPFAKKMVDLYRDLDIMVRIGKDGTFQGLENEKDVQAVFQKTVDAAKSALDGIKLDDEKKAFLDRVVQETATYGQFRTEVLGPLHLMLMVTGTAHSKTEVYQQESTANIMLARDVPTVEEYQIDSIDSEQKTVTVAYSQIAEGEKAAKMIQDAVEAFAKRLDPTSKETIEVEGIISKVNGKLEMNYENGWPRKIEWKVKLNDFKTGNLQDRQFMEITSIESAASSPEKK